jgi:hypothetical protein
MPAAANRVRCAGLRSPIALFISELSPWPAELPADVIVYLRSAESKKILREKSAKTFQMKQGGQ